MRRFLWANNTVTEELVHAGKSKTAALPDALPSSELTPIEDSSDSQMSSPSPQHPPTPPVRQRATKKAAEKRKLELATEEQGPETESQPKRQKAPSSDSSMEISEVKPAPKPSNAASKAKSKAGGKTAGVTSLKTRSQARHTQMQKIKSTSYVVDSDDGMEGIEGAEEDHKQVIGE